MLLNSIKYLVDKFGNNCTLLKRIAGPKLVTYFYKKVKYQINLAFYNKTKASPSKIWQRNKVPGTLI